ncbi:hypothetical protein HJC23_000063 [Cyclotella cryptica]|uniref:NAD-dependent epimerase/dehydratase domain-containing protein n=1 Tax=Cyclotella cryptica TaxID=29204 RepID=A0ABD3PMH7_9STRA|eukprot:CCRYP_014376-RA/>CCRYP_014376-RA protein AED:0.15 eAED:0.15 QI:139/-1/1/1/-1/1/1/543/916
MTKIRRKSPPPPSSMTLLFLAVILLLSSTLLPPTTAQETADDDVPSSSSSSQYGAPPASEGKDAHPSPRLTSDSVVLITGAAGFLGSELALALRRTYNVKRLLLVDNLGIESENESAYVPGGDDRTSSSSSSGAIYEKWSEETLSLFEIRRQRIFRVFHELTSPPSAMDEDDESPVRNSNNGPESIRFYRADIRPSIPEFFDFGEVPLLEGIFAQNPDITHVVHLADVPLTPSWGNQAVPRSKDGVKAGRMEGVLEELRMVAQRHAEESSLAKGGNSDTHQQQPQHQQFHAVPHFVYASSSEVYDALASKEATNAVNPPPFREHLPITTPSTLRGASKLMEEILASAYHSAHGIYSVGLRLFDVYGPWSTPGTEVFDLVEKVAVEHESISDTTYEDNVKDYVFIDDAVDAIMAAMQYRSVQGVPVVFNVGTGKGTTLRQMEEEVSRHFPKVENKSSFNDGRISTTSIASTARSEALLGFKAQTSLQEGLAHTISWHRDRSLPYGHDPSITPSLERQSLESALSSSLDAQRPKCSPLDRECLRGSPVFPCASECRRSDRCTPSAWDDVASLSRAVTSGCDAVLYTILLDEDVEQIPSATLAVGVDSSPYVGAGLPSELGKKTAARCNVAFVSERSPLVQRLRSEGEEYVEEDSESGLPNLLRHGFWTVLPVSTPKVGDTSGWLHAFSGRYALEYLPKISPGRFFGSSVRYAAYAAPTVLLDNLPKLLKTMEDGPPPSSGHRKGVTALLIPSNHPTCDPSLRGSSCPWSRPPKNDSLQASVYNTIRVALRGKLLGGSLYPTIDTSFVIHSLGEEDARLFRCDVYAEVAEWGASGDERALEFIVSLHDLWSKAVMHWNEQEIWWDKEEKNEMEGEEGTSDNGGKKGLYLGMLSSTDVQLFTHIVPSEGMGIIHLEDYQT